MVSLTDVAASLEPVEFEEIFTLDDVAVSELVISEPTAFEGVRKAD